MKIIIIYYTLEGNTRFAATELAKQLGADILELIPEKPIKAKGFVKYIWGGRQAVTNAEPELKKYNYNPNEYQLTILASPIWALNFTPAFNTFIKENTINGDIALISCHDGGDSTKAFNKIKDKLPKSRIIATLDLLTPLKNQESTKQKLKKLSDKLLMKNE